MELPITVTLLRTHILTLTRMDTIRIMAMAIQAMASDSGSVTVATTAAVIMAAIVDQSAASVVERSAAVSAAAEQSAAVAAAMAAVTVNV